MKPHHHNPKMPDRQQPREPQPDPTPERMIRTYAIHRDSEGWVMRTCEIPESVVAQYVTHAYPANVLPIVATRVSDDVERIAMGLGSRA
jgi:hypothetical protein